MVLGSERAVFTAFCSHFWLLNSSRGCSYTKAFLDSVVHFLMMKMMVQLWRILVVSGLPLIWNFLKLVIYHHLIIILL